MTPTDPKIVFIGGTGRSGTNISKAILSKHPEVASLPFEYRFIIDPDGLVDFYKSFTAAWSPYMADRRLRRLEKFLRGLSREPLGHRIAGEIIRMLNRDGRIISPRQYHRWHLNAHLPNFEKHVNNLMRNLVQFTFPAAWVGTKSYTLFPKVYYAGPILSENLAHIIGNFIKAVIGDFLASQKKSVFVEDNTWNILFAQELLEFVPTAKILHVYRDPRDVIASFVHQRWSPSDVEQATLWYRDIMTRWLTIRNLLPPDAYFEYSLEELVQLPKTTLSRICDFIGIPFAPSLLEIDLSHSHRGRWRKDFSPKQIQVIENILYDILIEFGFS